MCVVSMFSYFYKYKRSRTIRLVDGNSYFLSYIYFKPILFQETVVTLSILVLCATFK